MEFESAYNNLKNCEGYKFIYRKKAYGFSHYIFEGNAAELENKLLLLEKPKSLQRFNLVDNKNNFVFNDLIRLLHNFLSSAKALIDHTRVFLKEHYNEQSVQQDYTLEIKENFQNDQLCRFVQDLRNYMVHRGIPGVNYTQQIQEDRETVVCSFNLNVEELVEWSRWTGQSREFLKGKGNQINVSSIVTPYADKITKLYLWFDDALKEYHAKDLEEYEELKKIINEMKLEKT